MMMMTIVMTRRNVVTLKETTRRGETPTENLGDADSDDDCDYNYLEDDDKH